MEARQTTLADFMEQERQDNRFEPPKAYDEADFADIFSDPNEKKATPKTPKKPVKVTRNKSGPDRFVIRFGFSGDAVKHIDSLKYTHVMPSFIEKDRNRIYFKFFREKVNKYAFKLCRTSEWGGGYYFTFSPSEKADKLYQTWYVNKSFDLHHDHLNNCKFITIEED